MAQDITLMGASYAGVPAVTLPKTGGGTASFTDVTDTTATASDVAQGKWFHLASGERVQGTSEGGGEPTLPSEYQRVEYVSMVEGQYCYEPDPITFPAGTHVYTRASRMSGTNEQAPWGVHTSAAMNSGMFQVYFASGADTSGLVVYGNNFYKAADYEVAKTGSPNSDACCLIANKKGYLAVGKYKQYGLNGNVYVFKAFMPDKDLKTIPLFDFVPCYRKSDGEVGFYEMVNGKYYTNVGPGEFGKGPDVS